MINKLIYIILMELSEYDEPYESPVVDLIYNNDTDTTNIHHIMLISDSVSAHQIFVDSANANTFPIVYSYYSDSSNLLQLLLTKFTHIQRISFVFHDPINQPKTFLDEKPFFTDDDIILGKTTFSDNVTFLQNLISQFTVSNIDFLACNSLIYDNWKTYYQLLTDTTTVIVGASDNLSGNIKYGADWVMENTNTDIKTIYFNDIIDEFPVFLAVTTLSKNGGTIYIKQGINGPEYSTDNEITWNLIGNNSTNIVNSNPSINNVLTVQFNTDMTFTNIEQYFICGSEYITFDGVKDDGYRITITFTDIIGCLGLISGAKGQSNVQNIHVASSGTTTLASSAGWVCQSSFGIGVSNVLIDNCSSSGDIGQEAGGICGSNAAGYQGNLTITNCHSLGDITGPHAGGIVGRYAANEGGNLTITNCYSEGKISGQNAGGIIGGTSGNHPDSIVTAFNCYSKGEIFGQSSGGIYGFHAGRRSTAIASQCYGEGKISGQKAGGICGDQASRSEYTTSTTIINCYSEGEISGLNAGGICGYRCGYDGTVIISNSYSKGQITGSISGGLCGSDAGMNNGSVTITNSYSLYASGDSNRASGGMIGPSASTGVTFTNTYGANGTWSSTDANINLTGTPTVQTNEETNEGTGTTWSYYIQDTPYILTAFIITVITGTTLNYTINSTSMGVQLDSIVFDINDPIINIPTIVRIDGNDYSVTTVNANLFTNNATVTKITIPETVTSILGDDIFSGCSALTDVNLGLVTSLGNNTFKDCISLLNVILSDSVTSLGDNTFDGCISLEYVSLGSITTISDNTFNGCTALKRFNIPGTAQNLYSSKFFGISTLSGTHFQGSGIYSGPMFFNFSLI